MLDGFAQDVRYALRGLRRSSGFAAAVIATIAVGIGINAAVFTVTKAVLFDGFPLVESSDRIHYVTTTRNAVYYPDFEAWRSEAKSFDDMGLSRGVFKTLTASGVAPQTLFATEVTANTFGLLGVRPMLGRDFVAADQRAGSEPVVILRHDLWAREFGRDPTIIGKSVRLSGVPATVIGVMPEGFSFPEQQRLWTPLVPTAAALSRETFFARYAFGRLATGATLAGARAELSTIGRRLAQEYPRTNEAIEPVVWPFDEWLLGANGIALYLTLWGAVSLVLLIVCANVGNLLLGRALLQSRDVAIRSALGAGSGRIVRQLTLECLVLSACGGAAGWLIARAAVWGYAFAQPDVTRVLRFEMDERVVAYVFGISIAIGLLISVAAATRLARLDVNAALKSKSGAADGRRSRRTSNVLVGSQMTLAVTLLASASLMIQSFLNLSTANVGVDASKILSASLYLPPERYPDVDAQIRFYERLEGNLRALSAVEASGLGVVAPTERLRRSPYELTNAIVSDGRSRPTVADMVISSGYFGTLGSTMLAGRDFDELDRPSSLPVAIVNEQLAKRAWPGENAIGKQLRVFHDGEPQVWRTIVGVVGNIVQNDATRQTFEPLVYVPYPQDPSRNMFVFARARDDPQGLTADVSREVYSLDPDLPVPALMPLANRLAGASAFSRNVAAVFLAFAGAALLLTCVGLYAAVARTVISRTHEIGVRIAMGASRRDISRLVLRIAKWPLLVGLGLGLTGAFAVGRVLQAGLVGVAPADPLTFSLTAVVLVVAAAAGCAIPARRAMRIDPISALRND